MEEEKQLRIVKDMGFKTQGFLVNQKLAQWMKFLHTIFMNNITKGVSWADIKEIFDEFGVVVDAFVPKSVSKIRSGPTETFKEVIKDEQPVHVESRPKVEPPVKDKEKEVIGAL
ncbi:RNA recognition motif domain - like 10 [Theobroma cacao]|nr:RNA recognition motif domain - like 10 [Theobroma cacao]